MNNAEEAAAPGIRFRNVTLEQEVFALHEIALEYHEESRYSRIEFSRDKFIKTYSSIVTSKNSLSIVAELGGKPVGLMGAQIGEYFLGVGPSIATNFIFYVSNSIRGSLLGGKVAVRLMQMLLKWAELNGAHEVNIHAVSGIDYAQTDRFLRSYGFAPYGGNYAKELRPNSPAGQTIKTIKLKPAPHQRQQ